MTFAIAVDALQWALRAGVFGLAGLIVCKMLVGTVPLSDLLSGSEEGDAEPERVQALLAAIGIPAIYLFDCVSALKGVEIPRSLPEVQTWMLATGFSSQALYLIGKILRR